MKTRCDKRRRGNVLVLTIFLMVGMFAFLAFAVDLGFMNLARTELQRAADAAAIAAAWNLVDDDSLRGYDNPAKESEIRAKAAEYASVNRVTSQNPGLAVEDVTIGYLPRPMDRASVMLLDPNYISNAVQVRVRKTADQNGEIPLIFARVLGFNSTSSQAEATAALLNNIRGFGAPASGGNLELLPFALDVETWQNMLSGGGTDDWHWNPELGTVASGSDGIREVNLFPQGTGAPGNRGTVDVGSSNNSTADIARQIVEGISPADLAHHGGVLELDANGELALNGDTGISAGVKDELASIIGDRRIIPLFSEVSGPGNNAEYTIVSFAGVRIMYVKLTGSMSSKRLLIQPANIVAQGVIPAEGSAVSQFIYSPVWLVR